jgi:hypothetical protein
MINKKINYQGRIRDILITENEIKIITNHTDGRGDPSEDEVLLKMPLE